MPLVSIFFCDTNELQFKHVYIPYEPLQDCDYMQIFYKTTLLC